MLNPDRSLSAGTRKTYAIDFDHFSRWCIAKGLQALPASPDTVATYLSAMGDERNADGSNAYKYTTIQRRLSAICRSHVDLGHPSPRSLPTWQVLGRMKHARKAAGETRRTSPVEVRRTQARTRSTHARQMAHFSSSAMSLTVHREPWSLQGLDQTGASCLGARSGCRAA